MRKCASCGRNLELKEFYRCGKTKKGDIRYSNECKECRKKREKTRYENLSNDLSKFKKPCIKCGVDKPYLIEFHHRESEEKDFAISQWRKKSRDLFLKELEKCDTLCRNCHREFHYLNKTAGLSYEDFIKEKVSHYDKAAS